MKKALLAVVALSCIAVFFVNCGGSDDKTVTPPSQTLNLAFLEQKPNSNLVYPVLADVAGSKFNTFKIEDPSTGEQVSAAMGSIILNTSHTKAVFEVYGGTVEGAPTNQWDLYIGSIDGVNLTQITNDSYDDYVPQFNPAGTKVVYSSEREGAHWFTVVRNADGTGEQVLPQPFDAEESWHPSFSPDGTKIAVEAWGVMDGTGFDGIVLMNADGSDPTLLTNPYGAGCWCWDEDPYFTPDGTQIVFSREDEDAFTEDIYIMNANGTAVTKLTDGVGYNFDPIVVTDSSTSAKRIVFSSNRDNPTTGGSGFELYVMNLDGGGLSRLTYNSVYDGFNQENMEQESANEVRRTQRRHEPRRMTQPAQRLRW
jgi:Tol biopolymer transport system component